RREAEEKEREADRMRRREASEAKEREEQERLDALKAKAEEDERQRVAAADAAKRAAEPTAVEEPAAARTAPRGPAPSSAPRKQERDGDQKRTRGKGMGDDSRRSGRLTLNQALAGGEGGRQRSMAAMKRQQARARQKAMGGTQEREKIIRDVQLPETIAVAELANRMAERVGDVIKALMKNGMMVTQNEAIDADTAELIIAEFGHRVVRVSDSDVEDVIAQV